jgi:hypothetical protein
MKASVYSRFCIVLCIALVFFLQSCDPAYHLQYAVMNTTAKPVYCVDKKKGAASATRIEADSLLVVYEEAGFGFGKRQFKLSKPEVAERFVFYSDSTLSDSSQIVPRKGWKYYRLPVGDYNARVYIREQDLSK